MRSTVGGRRRNPRAHQGAELKIGPAAKNSSSRMPGSWLGITRSDRIRGWRGVHPVSQIGVHRDQQLAVDFRALIRGFRTPACCRRAGLGGVPASESLVRRKPRGGRGAVWSGAARPMGILGSRTVRWWGFGGRWRAMFSVGAKTTGFFEGEDATGGCGRGAWRRSADLVRTSPSCSSARLEARRNGVARRGAR